MATLALTADEIAAKIPAMCYSALAEQDLKKYLMKKDGWVDVPAFKRLFRLRFEGENLFIPKALEASFLKANDKNQDIREIKEWILEFKRKKIAEEQAKLFGFKTRLNDAERKLNEKATKTAQKEKDVCRRQIDRTKTRLENLESQHLTDEDSRIFPMGWAPLLILKDGRQTIVPARYHLRPQGQDESFDRQYDGNYNARRENLEKVPWWKNLFGKKHGIFIFHRFFENVPKHAFEQKALRPGEKDENMVLEYTPSDRKPMFVAALYDAWPSDKNAEFYSAAAITMDPPAEVAATGHQRCIVPLPESLIDSWLEPGHPLKFYYDLLDKRVMPFFEHKISVA